MMNLLKKNLAFLLALVLCLSLAACGGDKDVVGDDWRVTGVVCADGTITREDGDVEISFTTDSGTMYLTWLWYIDGYYLFRGDMSTYTIDGADFSEYVGLWQWADENVWIQIYDDETWECLDNQGNAFQSGTLSVDSTGITFYSDGIDETLRFDRTVSGVLLN